MSSIWCFLAKSPKFWSEQADGADDERPGGHSSPLVSTIFDKIQREKGKDEHGKKEHQLIEQTVQ